MTKFHIKDNGEPAICKAPHGKCPLGTDNPHFETKQEARRHYEKSHSSSVFVSNVKNTFKKVFTRSNMIKASASGAAVTAVFSLSGCNTAEVNTVEVVAEEIQAAKDYTKEKVGEIAGDNSKESNKPTTKTTPGKGKPSSRVNEAIKKLEQLPVKGKAAKTGYSRSQFGSAWLDVDGNRCDTRNDILRRDLEGEKFKNGSDCVILSGKLNDPYTKKQIDFVRGNGNLVDIDHVVSLGNVWVSGGQQLSKEDRVNIANDPENLLAVDAGANRQKGDKNAAEWLPSNKKYRCDYVVKQIDVKSKYRLNITQPEKDAMYRVIEKNC